MEINNIPPAFTLPLRLAIISFLVNGAKTFKEIKDYTKSSDGNISVQLSKLEEWGYVLSTKTRLKKKNISSYAITEFGIKQLQDYVEMLSGIIKN